MFEEIFHIFSGLVIILFDNLACDLLHTRIKFNQIIIALRNWEITFFNSIRIHKFDNLFISLFENILRIKIIYENLQ
jgi:hypothetical protein